ncbi:hypothetical protein [Corynebacterium sp. NML130628]|uniref:hypothetical protein n=1 Tax=Corynebacterium sp. NML130628 TaxID=1906333 RepID=UPI0008FBB2EC|nr:hypothetical protein [Corynebacterium sp. NML130628]OIR41946.1 hypothetical protein BJP07_08405 [Corynebacterium sp. NML130628]
MKKIITAAVASAVIAGGLAAPAQAADPQETKCKITYPAAKEGEKAVEKEFTKAEADAQLKKDIEASAQLVKERAEIEAQLKEKKIKQEEADAKFKEIDAKLANLNATAPALRACAAGKNLSPSSSKIESTLSSIDGKLNNYGIGAVAGGSVLALLALIAVALPQVAPMLPPAVRDALPF